MIFYLGLLAFFLELFIMMHKLGFLSILALLAVLAIFGLNYFDRSYIKLTLGLLFASVLLDLLWVIFYMKVILHLFRNTLLQASTARIRR